MTLDWLIVTVAMMCALVKVEALFIAIWLAANILIIGVIDVYDKDYYWQSMALWAALFSLKDFVLLTIMAKMRAPLIIVLALFASCTFHQFLRFQIMTYNYSNLTLLEYRSTFMLLLSVIMLATVITNHIGGGNGGKRAKHHLLNSNNRLDNLLHFSAREAGK